MIFYNAMQTITLTGKEDWSKTLGSQEHAARLLVAGLRVQRVAGHMCSHAKP